MFSTIKSCGQVLEDYIDKKYASGVDVFEFRDLLARYSTNIIASVGFGIENDCINETDNVFRKFGAKIFEPNLKNGVRGMIQLLTPNLYYKLRQRAIDNDVEEFLFSIVTQTVEYRESKNITRNDFMQMLIQLKNQGYVSLESKNENESNGKEVSKLTLNELVAQCFVFYVAGKLSNN